MTEENVYGFCPVCGSPGKMRERRPNGYTLCKNMHKWRTPPKSDYPQVIIDDPISPYRDKKMTPEQKEKFTDEIVRSCDPSRRIDAPCPSDFGLKDLDEDKCQIDRNTCNECARQACEKFFEEHGI